MSAENRLTAEQLAALTPGDTVCIEKSEDLLRRRLTAGTVCRVEGSSIVVSTRSARGVPYIDRFGRRDGFRIGGGSHAELVNSDPTAAATRRRPEIARVDAAYRAWTRNRAGLDELHELQPAVAEALAGQLTAP